MHVHVDVHACPRGCACMSTWMYSHGSSSLTERIVMSLGKSLGIIAYALVMYMAVPTPSATRRSRLAIMNPTAEGISSTNLRASLKFCSVSGYETHPRDTYEIPNTINPVVIGGRSPIRGNYTIDNVMLDCMNYTVLTK